LTFGPEKIFSGVISDKVLYKRKIELDEIFQMNVVVTPEKIPEPS
jgi:hypothetical protein